MAAWIVKILRNQKLNVAVSAFIGKGNNNVEFSPRPASPPAPLPPQKKQEKALDRQINY